MKYDLVISAKCIGYHGLSLVNDLCRILQDDCLRSNFLIEFQKNIHGHDGGRTGKDGHCWWVEPQQITSLKARKAVNIICRKCGDDKQETDFYPSKLAKKDYICKECHKAENKKYRDKKQHEKWFKEHFVYSQLACAC